MEIVSYPVLHKSKRPSERIDCIVLHDTGGKTAAATLAWFCHENSKVSSHYLVGKDGRIYRCVEEEEKAWHAGTSNLWGEDNVNDFSIGIEIVDDSDIDPYPDEQLASLFDLCADIIFRRKIPLNRVIGHQHIGVPQGRKVDPGKDFPWYDFLMTLGERVVEKEVSDA